MKSFSIAAQLVLLLIGGTLAQEALEKACANKEGTLHRGLCLTDPKCICNTVHRGWWVNDTKEEDFCATGPGPICFFGLGGIYGDGQCHFGRKEKCVYGGGMWLDYSGFAPGKIFGSNETSEITAVEAQGPDHEYGACECTLWEQCREDGGAWYDGGCHYTPPVLCRQVGGFWCKGECFADEECKEQMQKCPSGPLDCDSPPPSIVEEDAKTIRFQIKHQMRVSSGSIQLHVYTVEEDGDLNYLGNVPYYNYKVFSAKAGTVVKVMRGTSKNPESNVCMALLRVSDDLPVPPSMITYTDASSRPTIDYRYISLEPEDYCTNGLPTQETEFDGVPGWVLGETTEAEPEQCNPAAIVKRCGIDGNCTAQEKTVARYICYKQNYEGCSELLRTYSNGNIVAHMAQVASAGTCLGFCDLHLACQVPQARDQTWAPKCKMAKEGINECVSSGEWELSLD